MNKIGVAVMALGAAGLLATAGCDRISHKNNRFDDGSRAERKAERRAEREGGGDYDRGGGGGGGGVVGTPATYKDGHPIWAANRRFSAEDNIQRMFEKNGAAFGAADKDAYVAKAHAFIDSPPAGVQTLSRRNGDKLMYDARSNTFAVATRDSAPRTMMKPDDGKAYWDCLVAHPDDRFACRRGGGGVGFRARGGRRAEGGGGSDDNG